MSSSSQTKSEEFLKICSQFKLGALVTEAAHPVTANLSEVAKGDIASALDLLFQADADVVKKFREFVQSGWATEIAATVLSAVKNGGRGFFTRWGARGGVDVFSLFHFGRVFGEKENPPPAPPPPSPPPGGERENGGGGGNFLKPPVS